jgi:hypothetical protein
MRKSLTWAALGVTGAIALSAAGTASAGTVKSATPPTMTFAVAAGALTPTSLVVTQEAPVFGKSPRVITGRLRAGTMDLDGQVITLRVFEGKWVNLGSHTTIPNGDVAWFLTPTHAALYQMVFSATSVYAGATFQFVVT